MMKWRSLFQKCKDKQKSTQVLEAHWSYLNVFYGSGFLNGGICIFVIAALYYVIQKYYSIFGLIPLISISKVSLIMCSACSMFNRSSVLVPCISHVTSDRLCEHRSGWIN